MEYSKIQWHATDAGYFKHLWPTSLTKLIFAFLQVSSSHHQQPPPPHPHISLPPRLNHHHPTPQSPAFQQKHQQQHLSHQASTTARPEPPPLTIPPPPPVDAYPRTSLNNQALSPLSPPPTPQVHLFVNACYVSVQLDMTILPLYCFTLPKHFIFHITYYLS